MSGSNRRERAYRVRAAREAPPKDAITSALTAQIILCIVLAVCILLAKKFAGSDYIEIKRQYGVMLSDPAQAAELAEKIKGSGNRFAGLFSELDKFMNKLRPEGPANGASAEDAPESADGENPEEKPDNPQASAQMDFDYLNGEAGFAYVAPAGGMFPADVQDTGEMLPPPIGSTLSPIYLSAPMKPPVTGIITSGFSYRYHPLTGDSDFHTGLDIAAAEGTPILAALPGEAEEVGYTEAYGNYIVLQHAENLKTFYAHCSEIIANEGMKVRQGERIALVGETGMTTGAHLHFSVIVEDEFADPAWVLEDYIRLVKE